MSQLPTLADLSQDIESAGKHDALNILLNNAPPSKWAKDHPMAAGVKYLPIDKVEFLLTRIFQQWRVEVLSYAQLFQSVAVHVRLHYRNPISGEWSYHDGLGAVAIQTDKGASAADLAKIKSDAVMKALPAAESYAVKDAAEKLGALFGKDLNRRDALVFEKGAYMDNSDKEREEFERRKSEVQKKVDEIKYLDVLKAFFAEDSGFHNKPGIKEIFEARKNELTNG